MNDDRLRRLIESALVEVAPDVDPSARDADLHDELGLDSMDLLNLTSALERRTGIEIAEQDLAGLRTLRTIERYIAARRP